MKINEIGTNHVGHDSLLTNPQYTLIVDTPGELDWYKLGQHIATVGAQDPKEFGQPESDMMIVAANKKQLARYMKELDRLGATYKVAGGTHAHPEIHSEAWSKKYKRSIDCNNPKGFSQRAHCAGRKKRVSELKIVKPKSVDTKGVKRIEMPQIHKDDYNEFIDYLQDNGAKFTKQTMPAKSLKATQGEFSDKGVLKQIQKYIDGAPKKPVIASSDNFIIDGHHRWLVAWNTGDTLEVFKVNIEADELLKMVKKFPKTTYKDIYTEELYDFNKDEPMKSTVAVPGYGTMSIDGLMKNVIDQTTAMLKQMQQGTQGFRNADYELNRNKVLPSKISALIQALDDLQAIRRTGGARSRNIQREAEQEELPIDVNKIFDNIQEFESKQYIQPEDADKMRRGVQSLTSGRQTINSDAILQLLTMVTR
jgi:hypothetical protein